MVMNERPAEHLYPFAPHYHTIKTHRLHYLDEGQGDPILMVHGNPTWSFLYRDLIREFRTSHRIVVPDHIGCGLSDKPAGFPYRLETHIDHLESLVLALDLQNITLMVHDWGGPIGFGFAVRYPERIRRLIITNTAAFSSTFMPWRLVLCRLPWLGRLLIRDTPCFCRAATTTTVVKRLPEEVRNGYLLPYRSPADRAAVYRFVQDIPDGPEHPSYELLLGIEHGLWMFRELPVAIAWGMRDWVFTIRFLKQWRRIFPQARELILPNAGHLLFEDAGPDVIAFLHAFLEESAASSAAPRS
jgi:haloalkane dehalogenase